MYVIVENVAGFSTMWQDPLCALNEEKNRSLNFKRLRNMYRNIMEQIFMRFQPNVMLIQVRFISGFGRNVCSLRMTHRSESLVRAAVQ